jgi:hypothetical protein
MAAKMKNSSCADFSKQRNGGGHVISTLSLALMADQTSSTAAKKSKKKFGGVVKNVLDLFQRRKSANDSASQSNSTRVFASGASDPVPGNSAGSAEPTASSKYIGSILALSTTT